MFYLISDKKHFYCVSAENLVVVDATLVKVSDTVSFKYNSKSYSGEVLAVSGKFCINFSRIC